MDEPKLIKDEAYYKYRYDLQTVLESLRVYWDFKDGLEAKRNEIKCLTT